MEAIENSIAQRANLLELDCQLTRDGVVVVSHDDNLSRQSGVDKDVGSLDFEELPLYKEELEVYFSPGHFAHGSDRHMVRLEDMFQRFPRTPMSVEVKVENDKLIQEIASLVRRFGRSEITIWASEKNSVMKKCKAANPEMPRSFTISRGIWLILLYYLGLLPFIPISEKFLMCFMPTIINRTYFPFSCSGLNQLVAVVTKWLIMRKSLIQHLEQRGVQVVFWCLNEESDFEVAYSLGASGVMTDYPTALRRYLDNHGAPSIWNILLSFPSSLPTHTLTPPTTPHPSVHWALLSRFLDTPWCDKPCLSACLHGGLREAGAGSLHSNTCSSSPSGHCCDLLG